VTAVLAPGPVQSRLVPPVDPTVPEDASRVEQRLGFGVPQRIRLDEEIELAITVPTGLAATWRDVPVEDLVSASAEQRAPFAAAGAVVGAVTRAPARLLVLERGEPVAAVPLIAGLRRLVPDAGVESRGARIELAILDWDVRAGALRGPGDAISHVTIAWRRADSGIDEFSTPPIPRRVVVRQPPERRMESTLGLRVRRDAHVWAKGKMLRAELR